MCAQNDRRTVFNTPRLLSDPASSRPTTDKDSPPLKKGKKSGN
jgi:hypothetical protein